MTCAYILPTVYESDVSFVLPYSTSFIDRQIMAT